MPTFNPPTYESPMRTTVKPLVYFRLTESQSVIRVTAALAAQYPNVTVGHFTTVKSPSADTLTLAGKEGIDWFLGGHVYDVTNATTVELQNAGYTVKNVTGYGNGAYGYGPYGG